MKKNLKRITDFFQRQLGGSSYGVIISTTVVSTLVFAGIVHTFFLTFPWIVCFLLGLAGVVILNELLGLLLFLLTGMKKRNRVYWFLCFFCILFCAMLASQAAHIMPNLIFSLLLTIFISLFGRSSYVLLRKHRFTGFVWSLMGVTAILLTAVTVFLGAEGFEGTYTAKDRALAKKVLEQDHEQKTLGDMGAGDCQVASFVYGMDREDELLTETMDLSAFAERPAVIRSVMRHYFDYDLTDVPLSGKVWYPSDQNNCPVLFIIHGNHSYTTDSYLGYAYLGEYLASHGYVVVSVDENSCNDLSDENDARAVLLLQNMKFLLAKSKEEGNLLTGKLDSSRIAIAGHSRGGEAVCEAYLFNNQKSYAEDGMIPLDYHLNIKSILAIAPCVDQYQPAEHEVAISDVNYLMIHGANDQDVSLTMGEKQYSNITYSGQGDYFKSMLYIANANHGQFNSEWGKYDIYYPVKYFLNVAELMEEKQQQEILKLFTRVYLDVTLKGDKTNEELLRNCAAYARELPETIYQQTYQSSSFVCLSDFEEDADLSTATMQGAEITGHDLKEWTEQRRVFGNDKAGENYVLKTSWEKGKGADISFHFPVQNLKDKSVVFDVADIREDKALKKNRELLSMLVTVKDAAGHTASVQMSDSNVIYSSLPVKLYKLDYLANTCEFKHQFQTVMLPERVFTENEKLDWTQITDLHISFDPAREGSVQIDNVGFQ